jgi:hypothetical protein
MLSTRDQELVLAGDRGETTGELAERYGISHQRVSYLVARATESVNRVDLDLVVARKTGEVVVYVIPYSPDYTLALDFSMWLIKRLRDGGMVVDIETRRAHNGLALLLSDVTRGGRHDGHRQPRPA